MDHKKGSRGEDSKGKTGLTLFVFFIEPYCCVCIHIAVKVYCDGIGQSLIVLKLDRGQLTVSLKALFVFLYRVAQKSLAKRVNRLTYYYKGIIMPPFLDLGCQLKGRLSVVSIDRADTLDVSVEQYKI